VLDSGGVMRVKIWDKDARSSTPTSAAGRRRVPAGAGGTPGDGRPTSQAKVTNLGLPENRFEAGERKLLEVYRPVWLPNHTTLLFETYSRYDR